MQWTPVQETEKLITSLMEVGKANGVAFKSNDARGFFDSLSSGWLTMDTLKSKMEELNGTGIDSEGMTKSLDEINDVLEDKGFLMIGARQK